MGKNIPVKKVDEQKERKRTEEALALFNDPDVQDMPMPMVARLACGILKIPPGKRNFPNGGIIPKGIDNATRSIIVITTTIENFIIVFRVTSFIKHHILDINNMV